MNLGERIEMKPEKQIKKRKIVIIRGIVTAGKTTTSYELAKVLPGWLFVDVWKIKEMFEPLNLEDRTPLKEISKKSMILIMKEAMKTMNVNIIVQESSQSFIKKYLSNEIREYGYELYSFFLDVDDKDIVKRDKQREKPDMNFEKEIEDGTFRSKRSVKVEKEDVVINTSFNSVNQVVDKILKEIDESKQKNPGAFKLRKSW
jgi:gluconate kinase